MGWTLDDARDLPSHVYDFLVEEINAESEKARR